MKSLTFSAPAAPPVLFQSLSCSNLSFFSVSLLLLVSFCHPPSLLSRFLHAILDLAEDLSGDGKVTLFINLSVALSFLSCLASTLHPPGKGTCVCILVCGLKLKLAFLLL